VPKVKERKEQEFHKAKIRELQKQVRQLQKQLAYFHKREHILEIVDILSEDDIFNTKDIKKSKLTLCPHCKTGEMLPKLEFEDKTIYECLSCNRKKSVKK
jgi:lauroyl/myristoyl acyltransferase